MTDNIIKILKNAISATDIIIRNNSLDCIITSNSNGLKNEYTFILNENGITIRDNLTGVILRNQKYNFEIINTIIGNFDNLIDYKYKEIDYFYLFDDYNGVEDNDYGYNDYSLNLLNATFRYIDNKISSDFIEICNKRNLINKDNYFLFLKFVCEAGNLKIFKYLMLSYLEYFKSLDNDEKSILTGSACFSGNLEIIHILLQNKKFIFGFNALKGAIFGKNFNIFEFLVENNITNINAKNEKGETILFDAIKNNYIFDIIINKPEIINTLLDSCDPYIGEIKPLIGEYLLSWSQLDINTKNEFEKTILHFAAQNENPNIIRFLFERKPEIIESLNEKDDYNSTPLHLAAGNRNVENIKFLLTQPGIEQSLNESDETGWTPIRYAAQNENPNVIRFLLEKPGIETSLLEIDEDGWNLLHYVAAFNNNPEIIRLLLEKPKMKERLNSKDSSGETPLYIAIKNKNPDMVKFLLSQENIKIKDKEIDKIKEYFNYNKKIIDLMNNCINRTKVSVFNDVIGDLSDNVQIQNNK